MKAHSSPIDINAYQADFGFVMLNIYWYGLRGIVENNTGEESVRNITALLAEMRAQGYQGTYASL
jgi:hypothetical protein